MGTLWTDWDLDYRRSGPERHFDNPEDQDYWDWDYRRSDRTRRVDHTRSFDPTRSLEPARRFDLTRRFDLVRPDLRQDSREDSIMSLQGPIQTLVEEHIERQEEDRTIELYQNTKSKI